MMKPHRTLTVLVVALCAAVFASGCAGASAGAGNTAAGNTGTLSTTAPTATATPKPKPAGAPTITVVTCQGLMSLAEANSIMHPAAPATTLQANSADNFGVCNYLSGPNALVLKIFLETYTGPVPVPQATLQGLVAQLAQDTPGITITTATTVSGVGDQAAYLAATSSGNGYTFDAKVFYTIYGKVLFGCVTYSINGVGQNGTQSQLQQCAEQVVSRL